MQTKISTDAVLLLIDVQQGFDRAEFWGTRNNLQAEANMARLLTKWRETGRPVIHVQHLSENPQSPLYPGQAGCEIKEEVRPVDDEPLITKSVNSAFIGTDLEARLREMGAQTLVIVGLTTNHCVSTTTRMAGNLGFTVYLVADGTATFERVNYDGRRFTADEVHAISLANLHEEFATVLETADVLEALV